MIPTQTSHGQHWHVSILARCLILLTHPDLPVDVQATGSDEREVDRCASGTSERVGHLASFVGMRREGLECLDLGRQGRAGPRRAVLDADPAEG